MALSPAWDRRLEVEAQDERDAYSDEVLRALYAPSKRFVRAMQRDARRQRRRALLRRLLGLK